VSNSTSAARIDDFLTIDAATMPALAGVTPSASHDCTWAHVASRRGAASVSLGVSWYGLRLHAHAMTNVAERSSFTSPPVSPSGEIHAA
jgi:hypothetical protein